jgi:hypothetical protein
LRDPYEDRASDPAKSLVSGRKALFTDFPACVWR